MPNWKKVIVSGSNAVLNNVTASGHMSVLNDSFTVNTHTQTELEVVGTISASLDEGGGGGLVIATNISASNNIVVSNNADIGNELKTKYRKLEITTNDVANFNGDVVFFGDTTSMAAGRIYRFQDSGDWTLADKDNSLSGKQLLAVALGDASNINGMLIRGFVTLDDDVDQDNNNADLSKVLYLEDNGQVGSSPPTGGGDVSRIIGYSVSSNTGQIYFNPSMDWIDITT